MPGLGFGARGRSSLGIVELGDVPATVLGHVSGQKDAPGVDEKPLRVAYLTVLAATCVLPPSLQYVFGKYRHVRYKLGILPTAGGRILDAAHGYRGTDYADVVFLYRPTLLRLVPSPQKEKLLHLADERDAKEFGA